MNVAASPSRRQFIKTFLLFTASSTLLDKLWTASVLAEVRPLSVPETGSLSLNLADFPALNKDFGSVRLGTSSLSAFHPTGRFYPVIINRASGGQFIALNSECTHAGCAVPILNAAHLMQCPCHGSQYAIDGKVIRGPAGLPLQRFNTLLVGADVLNVEIPGMDFSVTTTSVESGPQPKLRLDFQALSNVEYEVRFRAALDQVWTPIAFATAADGLATQSIFKGRDATASLFVERTTATGFYVVAMRVRPV